MSLLKAAETLNERMIDAAEDFKFAMQMAVRAAMKKQNIKQRELAALVGCSPSNISQLLSYEANPRAESVAKILAALDEDFAFACESLNGKEVLDHIKGDVDLLEKIERKNRRIGDLKSQLNDWKFELSVHDLPPMKLSRGQAKAQARKIQYAGNDNFNFVDTDQAQAA